MLKLRDTRKHLNPGIEIENSKNQNLVFLADSQDLNSLADLPPKWSQHLAKYPFGGRFAAPKRVFWIVLASFRRQISQTI